MCTSVDLFKKKLLIKNICIYMYIHAFDILGTILKFQILYNSSNFPLLVKTSR